MVEVRKHLVDNNLFSVGKHSVDTEHLASLEMLTDLTYMTYLPDLTIYENFDSVCLLSEVSGLNSKFQEQTNKKIH